jgi:hypothetical protein
MSQQEGQGLRRGFGFQNQGQGTRKPWIPSEYEVLFF